MTYTLILSLCTGLSTAAAVIAAIVAGRRVRLPRAKLAEIELDVTEIFQRLEQLQGQVKRHHARMAARERREKTNDGDPGPENGYDASQRPGESDAAWKARTRLALQTGRLKLDGR